MSTVPVKAARVKEILPGLLLGMVWATGILGLPASAGPMQSLVIRDEPQLRAADSTFQTWQGKQSFTRHYLKARGLLAQGTVHTTHPGHSGGMSGGVEQPAQGSSPQWVLDSSSRKFHTSGDWQIESALSDKHGPSYLSATGGMGDEQAVWVLDVPETGRYEVAVWYPGAANQATDAPFTVLHAGGATTVRLNQQISGGQWVKLGDFQFEARQGQVVLSNKIADPSKRVVADSVSVTRRPEPGSRQ